MTFAATCSSTLQPVVRAVGGLKNAGLVRPSSQCPAPFSIAKSGAKMPKAVRSVVTRAQSGASTATATTTVPVSIVVPDCRLAFGEGLRLVGSCPQMGGWELAAGAQLTWQEGDNWSTQLDLPPGQHSFKLVIVRGDGSSYWEQGGDRQLSVVQQSGGVPISATCRFGDTSATSVQADLAPGALQVSASGAASAAAASVPAGAASAKGRASNGAAAAAVGEDADKAAKLLAKAIKAVDGKPDAAKEAEQLQAAVEAAAARVADLDRRKDELAAKLDSLQAEMENKLDVKADGAKARAASPSPAAAPAKEAAKPAEPKAAAKSAAATNGASATSSSSNGASAAAKPAAAAAAAAGAESGQGPQTGWLFKAGDADGSAAPGAAGSSATSTPASSYPRAILAVYLFPILMPLSLAAYMSFVAAFPELNLPQVPVKELRASADKMAASLGDSLVAAQQSAATTLAAAQQSAADSLAAAKESAQRQLPSAPAVASPAAKAARPQ